MPRQQSSGRAIFFAHNASRWQLAGHDNEYSAEKIAKLGYDAIAFDNYWRMGAIDDSSRLDMQPAEAMAMQWEPKLSTHTYACVLTLNVYVAVRLLLLYQ